MELLERWRDKIGTKSVDLSRAAFQLGCHPGDIKREVWALVRNGDLTVTRKSHHFDFKQHNWVYFHLTVAPTEPTEWAPNGLTAGADALGA